MLVALAHVDELGRTFLGSKVGKLQQPRIEDLTVLARNDEDPVPSPALEGVLVPLASQESSVCLERLDVLGPVDEGVFGDLLDRQVNTLFQADLFELLVRAHVNYERDVLVVIHVCQLLRRCDSDLHRRAWVEELGYLGANIIRLDPFDLLVEVEFTFVSAFNHLVYALV